MQTYEEIWKDVPNYEGRYQVSSLGRVRSLSYNHTGKERILKLAKHTRGYLKVDLSKNAKSVTNSVHRLVMLAFVGESELDVNHKNGIKTDNRLENLEYCTRSENVQHAFKTGLSQGLKGENNGNAKLTEDNVRKIKYGHKGMKLKDVAKIYGIAVSLVSLIRSGNRWFHI